MAELVAASALVAGVIFIWSLCRSAAIGDRALSSTRREPSMDYPPVRQPPAPTPYLNALLVLVVALAVALIAAIAGRLPWIIAGIVIAVSALLRCAWLEQH